MELFDLLLFIVIGGFALFGVWFGFVHTLGSLLGTVIGVFVASRNFEFAAQWLQNLTGWEDDFSRVMVFTIFFVVLNRLIGFLFWVVDRAFNVVTRLPFISGINRFLGLLLGTFEGLVTVGFFVFFYEIYPFSPWISDGIAQSHVAALCLGVVAMLMPLVPEGLRALHSAAEAGVDFGVELLEDAL